MSAARFFESGCAHGDELLAHAAAGNDPRNAAGINDRQTGIGDTTFMHPRMWYRQLQIWEKLVRLLASTDIAMRVLIMLAQSPAGQHLSVDGLARGLGDLSRHHLHKIVQDLTALGVTRTIRGAGGGVLLAKPPDQIRLGDLVRRLEGDQAIVECFRADGGTCVLMPGCRLRGMLSVAQQSFYESLNQNTLADCLLPTPQETPAFPGRPKEAYDGA